jgi:hypothetical protein
VLETFEKFSIEGFLVHVTGRRHHRRVVSRHRECATINNASCFRFSARYLSPPTFFSSTAVCHLQETDVFKTKSRIAKPQLSDGWCFCSCNEIFGFYCDGLWTVLLTIRRML